MIGILRILIRTEYGKITPGKLLLGWSPRNLDILVREVVPCIARAFFVGIACCLVMMAFVGIAYCLVTVAWKVCSSEQVLAARLIVA